LDSVCKTVGGTKGAFEGKNKEKQEKAKVCEKLLKACRKQGETTSAARSDSTPPKRLKWVFGAGDSVHVSLLSSQARDRQQACPYVASFLSIERSIILSSQADHMAGHRMSVWLVEVWIWLFLSGEGAFGKRTRLFVV
jgi:hypothetical protein